MTPEQLKHKVETQYTKLRGLKEYNASMEMLSFKKNSKRYKQYKYLRHLKGVLSEYYFQQMMLAGLPNHNLRFNIQGYGKSDIDCWVHDEKFGIDVKTSTMYAKPDMLKKNMCKFWYFATIQPKSDDLLLSTQVGYKTFYYLNTKNDEVWNPDNWELVEQGFYPVKGFTGTFNNDRFIPSATFIEWLFSRKC